MLNQSELKELLAYNPDTGVFVWRKTGSGRKRSCIAGCTDSRGYVFIGISKKLYTAHRLAWLYVNGEFPDVAVDHIDRNPSNNRIGNLRKATMQQNVANTIARVTSKSGVKGVCWDAKNGKWRATITISGKQKSLGRHQSIESAIDAYQSANKLQNGEFCPA